MSPTRSQGERERRFRFSITRASAAIAASLAAIASFFPVRAFRKLSFSAFLVSTSSESVAADRFSAAIRSLRAPFSASSASAKALVAARSAAAAEHARISPISGTLFLFVVLGLTGADTFVSDLGKLLTEGVGVGGRWA